MDPGNEIEESYLLHVDSLVQMAKNAGIRTDFKMTVYGTKKFSWSDFWKNQNGEFDFFVKAWERIWDRYKDEPFVFGYDLLNEAMKGDLDVHLKTDNTKGASRIFIGANRHYPDGFSIICNNDFVLYKDMSGSDSFRVLGFNNSPNPSDFIWDAGRQQLIILQWPVDLTDLHLKIVPGMYE